MTDRLREALQSVGVTTNGTDGARLFALLAMPTTGKTIISDRWNDGYHTASQLYEEVVAQGYTGSLRTIERIVRMFRQVGTKRISKQTITAT